MLRDHGHPGPRSPLTAHGHHQAVDVMRTLREEPITGIDCSTALRAQQTAAPLTSDLHIDITELSDLNEVGIGELEGAGAPAIHRQTAEVLRRGRTSEQRSGVNQLVLSLR
ncbi:histidine phosphatase family protein [Nocardia brasiliensis]|uniref:histidine phosphatase family protein n=1 Tax=Nocardia brasiliensis TaxID=37326 RepID=UPI0009D96DA0|nr:histidine phosphatase family protein [Nocardia brasiliensis]